MNRHTAPRHSNPPYTNGRYETPLDVSGVSPTTLLPTPQPARQPTVFLPDLALRGLGPLLYGLHRFYLGGMPAARYVSVLWPAIALLAAVNVVPGRWLTVCLALLLWVGQIILGMRLRRQNYVTFIPASLPAPKDSPLQPSEKLPIYATGLLNVEGRYQHFSAVPGFYRTFATGEHAVLCRVQERTWLGVLSWPLDEIGMWYAFINPSDIDQLKSGTLHFGASSHPALAVEYRLELPPGPRRKQAEMRREILYLASPDESHVQRLYVDLLANLRNDKIVAPLSLSH